MEEPTRLLRPPHTPRRWGPIPPARGEDTAEGALREVAEEDMEVVRAVKVAPGTPNTMPEVVGDTAEEVTVPRASTPVEVAEERVK
ncbi:hypothetical protein [Methanopyrus sp.]